MSLLPRPQLPSHRPAAPTPVAKVKPPFNPKRKKKCVKATSFPCGATCLPKMTKSGKETQCGNILRGQAKTFLLWLEDVQKRVSDTNNKRLAKGKAGIYIHDKGKLAGNIGIIGREPPPKVRKNARKAKPVEEPPVIPQREPVRVINKDILTDRGAYLPKYNPNLVPEQLRQHLSKEGIEGVSRAINGMDSIGGFLLADGTGIGKTRQQLSVAQRYAEQGKKVLIISPNAVIKPDYNNGTVSGSFADDSKTMGVNFTLNKGDKEIKRGEIHLATYQNLDKLKEQVDSGTILILDEAHNLKNMASQRTQYGMSMIHRASSVLYATATPADKPEHLYYLHRLDRNALARHMGIKQIETQNADGTLSKKWIREKEKAPKKHKMHGFMGRRIENEQRKKEKEKKPDKATQDAIAVSNLFDELTSNGSMIRREISMKGVKVNMTAIAVPQEAQAIMDKIEERYATGSQFGMTVARQLLDQRRQLEPFKVAETVRLTIDALKKGRQVMIFADRVNPSTVRGETTPEQDRMGVKGKVVAESEGTIALLRKELEKAGYKPEDIVEMHGQSDISQAEALRRYQSGEAKVMIGTPQVMGTGINADDVIGDAPRTTIVMTPPFSASELMQEIGRSWRKNTNSLPDFHLLFSPIGVDEWGRELLGNKLSILGASVGGHSLYMDREMRFHGIVRNKMDDIRSGKTMAFQERNLRGFGFHFDYN